MTDAPFFAPRLTAADQAGTVPDLTTAPPIGWGILGAGKIAASFARGIGERTPMHVAAVGSRTEDKAAAFASENAPGATAHGSYEALCEDPNVDVVYVATPHPFHLDGALMAIAAGKHLLVEKPLTPRRSDSERLINAARDAGVFLMEAVWTRFLPHIAAMRGVIARGEIGQVTSIEADFNYSRPFNPEHRMWNMDLAGGALLDLGIYPIQLAHDLLGVPDEFLVRGTKAPTGADDHVAMLARWDSGQDALLHTSLRAAGPVAARITGTEGRIEIPEQFHGPSNMIVYPNNADPWTFYTPQGEGKVYEAAEVARLIAAGATESPRHTWQDTLEIAALLDDARAQVGVVYPGEE
ncbi:MAG: Gfo/Idh/MocA family oxidoreductase [Cellulomonadaceae bacterium]|nr:Gfo/Idh/MocA family oxidoreductase [Cellulomonadaceae bacterium]